MGDKNAYPRDVPLVEDSLEALSRWVRERSRIVIASIEADPCWRDRGVLLLVRDDPACAAKMPSPGSIDSVYEALVPGSGAFDARRACRRRMLRSGVDVLTTFQFLGADVSDLRDYVGELDLRTLAAMVRPFQALPRVEGCPPAEPRGSAAMRANARDGQ